MTIQEMARKLARALQQHTPGLVQNHTVHHFEYVLHRELNAMCKQEGGQKQ